MKLSREYIETFVGEVVSLRVIEEGETIPAVFTSDSDSISLFPKDGAVLIAAKADGQSVITAEADGQKLYCKVNVRETVDETAKMNYYIGDFHVHTTMDHNGETFKLRTDGRPADVVNDYCKEGKLDFTVISDHACLLSDKEFMQGFIAADEQEHDGLIVLAGSESEVENLQTDRYGIKHKNAGEIVTVNCVGYASCKKYDEYYRNVMPSPAPVCVLAHPQVMGSSVPGIWNFDLRHNATNEMKRCVRMIEMGNGTIREETPLFEHILSVALDNGMTVSTTCSSDHHGPVWSADLFPGKTVIMAPEKSKEAFVKALRETRCYASESGNIRVYYTVNGITAPAHINNASEYVFHIEASHIDGTKADELKSLEIISDRERRLMTIWDEDFSSIDVTVKAQDASYFYLRFANNKGEKTWSPVVWTENERHIIPNDLQHIEDKSAFTAKDTVSGKDASILFSGDPYQVFEGEETAQIVIDLRKQTSLRAIGVLPQLYDGITRMTPERKIMTEQLMRFPCKYRLSASVDGINYKEISDGYIRIFGGEDIIDFEKISAKYLKLDVLETAGRTSLRPQFKDVKLKMGEIEFYM